MGVSDLSTNTVICILDGMIHSIIMNVGCYGVPPINIRVEESAHVSACVRMYIHTHVLVYVCVMGVKDIETSGSPCVGSS